MKKESRTRNPTQNNVDLCPIHTADADETKLSSRVASAVWTYPSAVVTRWLQNCKLGHGRRLRCAFASPNPSAVVANSCTHRRRQRDATKQFRLVGVGGVYWALHNTSLYLRRLLFRHISWCDLTVALCSVYTVIVHHRHHHYIIIFLIFFNPVRCKEPES